VVNICQMNFNFFFKVMGSYHNVLVLSPHNKMVWLKERIVIFLMLFEPFSLSHVFLLIFGVKLCVFMIHHFSFTRPLFLLTFSFTQSQYDSSLFFYKTTTGMVFLLVYVDDIILTGNDIGLITKLQHMLHSTFQYLLSSLHFFNSCQSFLCSC